MRFVTCRLPDGVEDPAILSPDGTQIWPLSWLGLSYETLSDAIPFLTPQVRAGLQLAIAGIPALPVDAVQLQSPIPCPAQDVVCLGINYMAHSDEAEKYSADAFATKHQDAIYFSKRVSRAVPDGGFIEAHTDLVQKLDYECELAVVLGKDARDVPAGQTKDYVFGYTILNDVSARDVQTAHKQWYFGKSLDGFTPIGPCIVTADEFDTYPPKLGIRSFVNGEKRQDSNTGLQIFDIDHVIHELTQVMEQNEQLEAENAELRQQIVDYDRIKAENEAYKALARIQDSNTEASYISAFVIGRDPLDEFGGFTLDCGTVNGAAVNDAVISDKGYLIGMVVEADTTSCKVMTILHPSFSAAGVVSRTRENGIINGSTDYAGDGLCVLTNLERATETKMGDQVITTGLGGVFPPDLLVGTVQKVEPEVSGKSSIAVVRPGADPRTVKHVFVITDY